MAGYSSSAPIRVSTPIVRTVGNVIGAASVEGTDVSSVVPPGSVVVVGVPESMQ